MPARKHQRLACARPKRWRDAVLLLVLVPGLLAAATFSEFDSPQLPPKVTEIQPHPVAKRGKVPQARTNRSRSMSHAARRRSHVARVPVKKIAPRRASSRLPRSLAAPSRVATPALARAVTSAIPATIPANEALPAVTPPVNAKSLVWLDVEINGQQLGIALLLRDALGNLWARRDELASWRLPVPIAEPSIGSGEEFYPLATLPGLEHKIDEAAQAVLIHSPARLFPETLINDRESFAAIPDRSQPGGFLNYDVVAAHSSGDAAAHPVTLNGLFEVGAFNRWGEATTTALRSSLANDANLIRLETTFTQDRPEMLASLRVGDSISGISSWGGALRFAGVQWSTDFTTRPGFMTTPLAGIRGEAILPSTLDLYINNALRLQTTIPPGPFAINDLPANSGQGEARVVVRNMLGQEQIISVPYYVSPSLLRAGLSSYSYEIGAARDNYGLTSNDYGRGLIVATDRYGFSDAFTGEVHAEILAAQQTAGLGGVWLVRGVGVMHAAIAASHSERGDGALLQIGIERQWQTLGAGASVRYAESTFVEIGMVPTSLPPVRQVQAYVSLPVPNRGSLSVDYTQQDYRTDAPAHLLSVQASWPVGRRGFLGLTALKPLRGGDGPTFGLNFTLALGFRSAVTAGAIRHDLGNETQVQAQQNLPAGTGMGYRVIVGGGASDQLDATGQYQNDVGTFALQATRINGQTSTSVEAHGGVALLNDRLYLSRKLDESFAVVHVGDFANVHIYADNQAVAETDATGTALVPRIRAYERNPMRIEQADLPLDVDIDTLERDAIPYRRSGVRVDFALRRSLGALVSLIEQDGLPIPVGAVVMVAGNDTEFPVGTKGETYLSGLSQTSLVRVSWPGKACEARIAFTPSADPLPKLGPLLCAPVAP
jgi:outer membrane usher protein